jgi:hypothetical protein
MNVEIKDGKIVITMPLQEPKISSSGKSFIIAGTGGFARTATEYNGKPVSVSLNATIPRQ